MNILLIIYHYISVGCNAHNGVSGLFILVKFCCFVGLFIGNKHVLWKDV